MKEIEIPFGAFDSELGGWEYTIPEGYEAEIKDGKVIVKCKENEDERIRKRLIDCLKFSLKGAEEQDAAGCSRQKDIEAYKWGISYLEKQKEQKPVEWSEEDKAYLRNLTDYFECNDVLAYTTREVIAWLKSLRPQP